LYIGTSMASAPLKRIAIVGVGLIGGSVGLAVRTRGLADEVVGIGRNASKLSLAKRLGAISDGTTNLAKGINGAELVIICTPVERVADDAAQVAALWQGQPRAELLITDVGSTKANILNEVAARRAAKAWPKEVRFIGSHPIAGNERTGVKFSNADLFEGKTVVITPNGATGRPLAQLQRFWRGLGAKVHSMTADEHDRAMAAISHLPHLLASAIAAATPAGYVTLAGTGWTDTTRIAAGDAELWRQILLDNRSNTLAALARFETTLAHFRQALESVDGAALHQLLEEAKRIRDAV
jgi:prephenate dehydrogenase